MAPTPGPRFSVAIDEQLLDEDLAALDRRLAGSEPGVRQAARNRLVEAAASLVESGVRPDELMRTQAEGNPPLPRCVKYYVPGTDLPLRIVLEGRIGTSLAYVAAGLGHPQDRETAYDRAYVRLRERASGPS
jgi:hypothetical protein